MKEDLNIRKRKLLILCSIIGILLLVIAGRYFVDQGMGMRPNIQKVSRSSQQYQRRARYKANHYQIHLLNEKTQKVSQRVAFYSKPGASKREVNNVPKVLGESSTSAGLVQPRAIAKASHRPTYIKISRQGENLGWVKQQVLKPTKQYFLPYVYTSQFWPSAVPDACEVASLKTAMSTQNKAMHVSLKQIVKSIPRTNDPNHGYTHNPYQYGSHATIYPDAMIKVAHRYGASAKNITGATKREFINEITHGKAVVFEGPYMMKKPGSDHDLTILGYKPHYFYVADPFARHQYSPRATWVSTSRLMTLFNRSFRHQRALVIG